MKNTATATEDQDLKNIVSPARPARQSRMQKNNGYCQKARSIQYGEKERSITGLEESYFLETSNSEFAKNRTSITSSATSSSCKATNTNSSTKPQTSDLMPTIHVDVTGSVSDRPPMPLPRAPSILSNTRSSGSSITSLSPTPVTAIREYTSARLLHLQAVGQKNALFTIGESGYVNDGLGPS